MARGLADCSHFAPWLDVEVALDLEDLSHSALWTDVEVALDLEGYLWSALGLDVETALEMLDWLVGCCYPAQWVEEAEGMDFQLCLLAG